MIASFGEITERWLAVLYSAQQSWVSYLIFDPKPYVYASLGFSTRPIPIQQADPLLCSM